MAEKLNIDPLPAFEGLTPRAQSWLRKFIQDVGYWMNSRLLENPKIRWVIFDGTLDADSQTTFAHGLTNSKILGSILSIKKSGLDFYYLGNHGVTHAVADAFRWYISTTNFVFDDVGTNVQGQVYRVSIYYVD